MAHARNSRHWRASKHTSKQKERQERRLREYDQKMEGKYFHDPLAGEAGVGKGAHRVSRVTRMQRTQKYERTRGREMGDEFGWKTTGHNGEESKEQEQEESRAQN